MRNSSQPKTAAFSFTPDFIAKTVTDIDFEMLQKLGITTCFLDLDGTVVSRGTYEVNPALRSHLKHAGIQIMIATNRPKSRSLKALKEDLSASGVLHPQGIYGKPSKRYFKKTLKEYGLKPYEVVMIGDRYIQDILGANRSGIYSLVVPKLGANKGWLDRLFSSFEHAYTTRLSKRYRKV